MRAIQTVTAVVNRSGAPLALRVPGYSLRVVKGKDLRRERKLSLVRVRIGTAEGAEFQLTDPTVSAMHCEILGDRTGFRVHDLGSKNGVLLGGRRVREAWLSAKDDFVLGETVVRFKQEPSLGEERPLSRSSSFGPLLGSSLAMRDLYAQLERAAASDAPVLLQGESGTGKDLAAEALMVASHRRARPWVVVECGRLPTTLAESELFGHEAGAFTGASGQVIGAVERASGGTLLLDEVGDLPLELQPKLLGFLERKSIQRVGGDRALPVDVRVIATTHHVLEEEINRGTFRADLFYRLGVIQLWLPPLRDRREDIPELIAHFLSELLGPVELPGAVLRQLCAQDYPGNVRELRNAVERAALGMASPERPAAPIAVDLASSYRGERERVISGFERSYVRALLDACHGNVSEAARRSGMNRVHLHAVMRRIGLSR
jgi:DNA-binding NtrC family response regulator